MSVNLATDIQMTARATAAALSDTARRGRRSATPLPNATWCSIRARQPGDGSLSPGSTMTPRNVRVHTSSSHGGKPS